MKAMKWIIVAAVVLCTAGLARADVNPALAGIQKGKFLPAPQSLSEDSYLDWLDAVSKIQGWQDVASAFTDKLFVWYENEKNRGLPNEVYQNADRIYVNVDRPKQETLELEDQGEIEAQTTIGAEVYAEMDGTIDQVLDVMLFRWGKPIGKADGETHPNGGMFSKRVEYFSPNLEWGSNGYVNVSNRTNGGLLKDMDDRFLVLIYGDNVRGYDIVMQFLAPHGRTATKKSLGIATMRPLPNGKTAFKITTRYQGQSYNIPLIDGRSVFGFNESKVRAVQKEFSDMLEEYRSSGKIKQNSMDDIVSQGKN